MSTPVVSQRTRTTFVRGRTREEHTYGERTHSVWNSIHILHRMCSLSISVFSP